MALTSTRLLCIALFTVFLSGCGVIDYFYLPPPEDTAQELFEAGNEAMREKNYVSAADYYTRLKDNYPFSPYTIEAELSLADSYFLDEEWGQASDAYKEFEGMHPRHEAIPYVLFQIGMSNMNGYPSIDRPIGPVEEAYSYFGRLRESYPGTEYADTATQKMAEARRLMAEPGLFYGDFYYRQKRYTSALSRYQYIVDHYSDVPEIYDHAAEKAKATFVLAREQEAEETRETREGSFWKSVKDFF